jgi:hypothetical protein
MRKGDDQKTDENKKTGGIECAETTPDDLFEIDPADFIDPEELGVRRKYGSFRP